MQYKIVIHPSSRRVRSHIRISAESHRGRRAPLASNGVFGLVLHEMTILLIVLWSVYHCVPLVLSFSLWRDSHICKSPLRFVYDCPSASLHVSYVYVCVCERSMIIATCHCPTTTILLMTHLFVF